MAVGSLPEWNGVVKEVGESNFRQEVLDSKVPVIVDFWGPACIPCKRMIPIVESMAVKYKNKISVVRINVEENQSLTGMYSIGTIPNILFFKDGVVQGNLPGTSTVKKIEGEILPLLR